MDVQGNLIKVSKALDLIMCMFRQLSWCASKLDEFLLSTGSVIQNHKTLLKISKNGKIWELYENTDIIL